MRLHRFYTTEKIADRKEVTINSPKLVNQLRNVFRLKIGNEVILFDGSGKDYTCRVMILRESDGKSVTLEVVESKESRWVPQRKIFLCVAITKKDTFEWIVEKATELGVTDIVPILAERSEKKSLNEERLRKISIEASEQSGRGDVPMVHSIVKLENVIDQQGATLLPIQRIAFHTKESEVLARFDLATSSSIAIFIGPEGGWSPKEVEMFHAQNIPIKSLGPQVLRAETAVIVALSRVVYI